MVVVAVCFSVAEAGEVSVDLDCGSLDDWSLVRRKRRKEIGFGDGVFEPCLHLRPSTS